MPDLQHMKEYRAARKALGNALTNPNFTVQLADLNAKFPSEAEQFAFEAQQQKHIDELRAKAAKEEATQKAAAEKREKALAKRVEDRAKIEEATKAAHECVSEQLKKAEGDFLAAADSCIVEGVPYNLLQPLWQAMIAAQSSPAEVRNVGVAYAKSLGWDDTKAAEAAVLLEFGRVFVPSRWVYATEAATCYNKDKRHMQSVEKASKELISFVNTMSAKAGADFIVKNAQLVQRFAFNPAEAPLAAYEKVESDGQGEQTFVYFNLFRGWRLKHLKRKVKASEVAVIIDHVAYVLGEGDLAPKDRKLTPLFLDWLAFQIQRPGVRIKWTWVIVSTGEQIGKDSLATIIERIIGHWNMTRVAGSELEDKRNTFLTEGHFAIVNEAMIPYRAMDNVRTIITEQMVKVRFLYGEWSKIESFAIIIFFSNKENALGLTEDSKRFVVVINEAERKADAYYKALWESIEGDGPQLFMTWLADRDISQFQPNQPPPMTGDMARMIEANTGGDEAALSAWIENRERPFDRELATEADLISLLKQERSMAVRPTTLRKLLARHGCQRLSEEGVKVKLDTNVKAKTMRLWALDNVGEWVALDGPMAPLIRGYALKGRPYALARKTAIEIAAKNPQATLDSPEHIEPSVSDLHNIRQGATKAEPAISKIVRQVERETRAKVEAENAAKDTE